MVEIRRNWTSKKQAVRNAERMVLGFPYRPETTNTVAMKLKSILQGSSNKEESEEQLIKGDEAMVEDDVFVDEDSLL